ncbi:DUF4183 domain-containing protein [Lentibacillus cibarius]|uniref:DUF4183 domain-containing protein n=1 Tax=Lentibacillus cibarius TaxID=2583219 RepID=UPI0015F2B753|nr:DUF4183 domain-containing protein [Lentibacillus cibarius]
MTKKQNRPCGECAKKNLLDGNRNDCRPCGCCCRCCKQSKENVNNCPVNTFNPTFNPSITVNVTPEQTPTPSIGLETAQYIALASEGKKVYTNQDALKQYGSSDILHPDHVSYINLFINGVLQPPSIYHVEEGVLYLKSDDLPPIDAPINLLFVIVKN